MREYPKFCYIYVAQPSLYKREFCFAFSPCIFCNIKNSPKYPKFETDEYQVFFIRLSLLTVAFHSKNDLIIKVMHLGSLTWTFLKLQKFVIFV